MSRRSSVFLVIWGVLLVLSLLFLALNIKGLLEQRVLVSPNALPDVDTPAGSDGPGEGVVVVPVDRGETVSLVLSVITTAATAAGFIATTVFALRQDRRETGLYQLQIENLRRDIAQKDLEIERLQQARED